MSYQWNCFYGAIKLDMDYASSPTRNHEDALHFFRNIMPEKCYDYFHPDIFSPSTTEIPYCYENVMFAFARTAKWLVEYTSELANFVREFEDILGNLDFEHAQIVVSGLYSNYSFFWINRKKLTDIDRRSLLESVHAHDLRLYEAEHLYFGLGEIDMSTGWCRRKYDSDELASFDIQYPDFVYPIP